MPAPTWIGQTIDGRYKIESTLGQGGMSTVYRAADPNLRRPVAVKLIHPHLAADLAFVSRFEEEAAAVAQLRHPNIIQVFDFDHDGDIYYMVMEFVPGETLQARLRTLSAQNVRLPLPNTVGLMATICDAVQYAHEQGMVHRDLKPANVMLNQQSQPILMDFGVAKMLGGKQHTATGAVIGTPQYISPELVKGERPDARSDIYSLGIVLYEMLAGRCPFDADSAITLMMMHINEPVPDIRVVVDGMPGELAAIAERALAKEPDERYQSASEMAEALRAVYAKLGMPLTGVLKGIPDTVPENVVEPTIPTKVTPAPPTVKPDSRVKPTTPPPQPESIKPTGGGFPWAPMLIGAGVLLLVVVIIAGIIIVPRLFPSSQPDTTTMIRVDKGAYSVGVETPDAFHEPLLQVKLEEFFIDQHEVTNEQFASFVSDQKAAPPASWSNGTFPTGEEKRPAQGVTWDGASAYCQWVKKRLPTEAEWEVAARGSERLLYPWGNNAHTVQLPRSGTYDVGSVSANRSRFGLFDTAGNVWEWVDEPYTPVPDGHKMLRGGSNDLLRDLAYRLVGDPAQPTMFASAGFRCAAPQVVGQVAASTAAPFTQLQLPPGVLLLDEFADPKSGWPVVVEDGNTTGYHPQSYYHLEVAKADDTLAAFRGLDFSDIAVETNVLVDHTDTQTGDFRYGLALNVSGEDYYAFLISSRTKTWQIAKHTASGFEVLVEGTDDSIRDGLAVNKLAATASSGTLTFNINGNEVAEVTDSSFDGGDIGFINETFDETLAHVHFDSIAIREAGGTGIVIQPTVEPTVAEQPTATVKPTLAATQTQPPPATATPEPAVVVPPVPEGMILIPAGFFQMGSSDGRGDEKPEHPVLLDAFYMDQTEVTNAAYRECVAAGTCTRSGSPNAADDLPVVLVNWNQAKTYCESVGKRLPSEAEWEFAASGPENFKWPWGNQFQLNLSAASAGSLRPVGSFPDGANPFGVLDMAGNANEWVADNFTPNFYTESPTTNPRNDAGGNNRLYRGGSYDNPDASYYTTSRRYVKTILAVEVDVGFRCAQDAPEVNKAEPQAARGTRVTEFCKAYDIYKPGAQCP